MKQNIRHNVKGRSSTLKLRFFASDINIIFIVLKLFIFNKSYMPIDKYQPRNILDIAISNNDIPANLYKHSLAILKLQESVRLALGPPLAQHLHVANISPDTIIIFTDSQAWATKLRFQTQQIINIAKKLTGFNDLESVRIKVSPLLTTTTRPDNPISISPSTTQLLRTVAENINDTALQTALLKLSRNN